MRGSGALGAGRPGFTLIEVVVGLLVLQVGLLGVVSLFTGASGRLTRALLVERATAEGAAVADSLSRSGAEGTGVVVRGEWRTSWEPEGGGLRVRTALAAKPDDPLAELHVP